MGQVAVKENSQPAFSVGFRSDPGASGRRNQDSLFVDLEQGLFIVADGMGGHHAGDVASALAVKEIAGYIERVGSQRGNPVNLVEDAVHTANMTVFEESMKSPQMQDMGTTVVVALCAGDQFVITHVGDSRAYKITDRDIIPLTQDHTFVAEWVKEGRISEEEARTHEARHGLYMALGVDDEVEPETSQWEWHGDWSLCLCSDGLTDVLRDEEILDVLTSVDDPQQACDTLVGLVHDREGKDDITVMVIRPPVAPFRGED
jgi:serine/threonine protein phosphatase PrpC